MKGLINMKGPFLIKLLVVQITVFWILMVITLPASCNDMAADFELSLQVPDDEKSLSYLGLTPGHGQISDSGSVSGTSFKLEQIDTKILVIQIFSMYCPICQREAKQVNTVYDLIRADQQLNKTIKVIGIGAGNSVFEAQFFKTNYNIEFPMFEDPKFIIHKKIGQVGTPHFFGLKITEGKSASLFFSHSGPIPEPEKFLQRLKTESGLEEFKKEDVP